MSPANKFGADMEFIFRRRSITYIMNNRGPTIPINRLPASVVKQMSREVNVLLKMTCLNYSS
jgi:hypothetical protein